MDLKHLFRKLSFVAFLLFFTSALFAQSTRVTGIVTDGSTKNNEPMPFVTVGFAGSTIGGPTDNSGRYSISSDKPFTQLKATFIGYKDYVIKITPGVSQVINIKLRYLNKYIF